MHYMSVKVLFDKLIDNNQDVKVFDMRKTHREAVEFIKGSITSVE